MEQSYILYLYHKALKEMAKDNKKGECEFDRIINYLKKNKGKKYIREVEQLRDLTKNNNYIPFPMISKIKCALVVEEVLDYMNMLNKYKCNTLNGKIIDNE